MRGTRYRYPCRNPVNLTTEIGGDWEIHSGRNGGGILLMQNGPGKESHRRSKRPLLSPLRGDFLSYRQKTP